MNRRLRIVLALILAGALAPLLIIAVAQTLIEARDERQRLHERLTAIGALVAGDLDEALARAHGVADAVASRGYAFTASPGGACRRAMAQIIASDDVLSNIMLTDANGRVTCSAAELGGAFSAENEPWFQAVREGAPSAFSNITYGAISQRPVIIAASRIERGGAFQGAAAAAVDVVSASRLLRTEELPDGARLAMVTAEGVTQTGLLVGRAVSAPDVPEDIYSRVATLTRPEAVRFRQDEAAMAGVLTPLVEGRLALLLLAPPRTLAGWGVWDTAATFLVPFLMYALALASVWLAVDFFVLRWLGYLRRIASVYAAGRLDVLPVRAKNAPYEFRELADTLADMAASLDRQRDELEAAVEQRGALLREIHHRVKNNLQIIVSLLNLQARRLDDGQGRAALMEARRRINALSLVHRSLYEADDLRAIHMPHFLSELGRNLAAASSAGDKSITVETRSDNAFLEPDKAVPTALFAAEAVTNAFKHAFKGRTEGKIEILFEAPDPERLRLTVRDDGVGKDGETTSGTGSSLMEAFAVQLGGRTWTQANADGGLDCILCVDEEKQELASNRI